MAVVASVLTALATEAALNFCRPIYSKVIDAFKFQSNFNALEQKMESLIERRNQINEKLVTADKEWKVPTYQVKDWLTAVEKIELEVNSMQANTDTVLCGCFLNFSSRCRLGTTVAEKLATVAEKLEEGNGLVHDRNFPANIVQANPRAKPVEQIPGPSIQTQTTASANLGKIINLLKDDAVRRIGIWGMAGVGKTTLVNNLNNNLKSDSLKQLFDIVILVPVSKDFNLKTVQKRIANRLNLTLKSEEKEERAIELHERLQKETKFLLILDDVWKMFDLHSLGVPQPEDHRGSNIILTSRSLEVCKGMGTDAEIKVDVLNCEEAWQLFVTYTGREATSEKIKPLAEPVAKECRGLPLALITVGRAMAGKTTKEEWKNALNELQRSKPEIMIDIEKEVYNPLKLSYDSLGKNVKPCFLYCSLFPEDWSIEVNELVQCWKAEGLMDEQQNFEHSHNRGIAIIQNLKYSCLLEEGDDEDTVKLHDVVRDFAIWIASNKEDDCKFVVESGKGLDEISDLESLKTSKRVSFMNNSITTLPDCVSPKTSTLLLQSNYFLESVPETFLPGFHVLRVLNMSQTSIRSLPLSLAKLGELRALILKDCRGLEKLPPLGGLRKLQLLDLSFTGIKELPEGMKELSNLSQLLLIDTEYLVRIEAGVLSKLSGLEVLDMSRSSYTWGMIGDEEEEQATFEEGDEEEEQATSGEGDEAEEQATLEELGCLTRLIVVNVDLLNFPDQDLQWIQRLRRFHISVGRDSSFTSILDERRVVLKRVNLSEKRIGSFLINATHLKIEACKEIGWLFEYIVTNTQGLDACKEIVLTCCDSSLGSFRGCAAPHDMIPNLEKLSISECNGVEDVRPLVALLGLKFYRLTRIVASLSRDLKYFIPAELIPNLINLEEIRIVDCENLERLFDYDTHSSSGQMVAADSLLPKLRKLELILLPELRSICRENEAWQSLEELIVTGCNQLKRIDPLLPKLRKLVLTGLPELRSICRGNESWQSLEVLHVEKCNQLKGIPHTTQNANTIKEITGEKEWWDNLDDDTKLTLQPHFDPNKLHELHLLRQLLIKSKFGSSLEARPSNDPNSGLSSALKESTHA